MWCWWMACQWMWQAWSCTNSWIESLPRWHPFISVCCCKPWLHFRQPNTWYGRSDHCFPHMTKLDWSKTKLHLIIEAMSLQVPICRITRQIHVYVDLGACSHTWNSSSKLRISQRKRAVVQHQDHLWPEHLCLETRTGMLAERRLSWTSSKHSLGHGVPDYAPLQPICTIILIITLASSCWARYLRDESMCTPSCFGSPPTNSYVWQCASANLQHLLPANKTTSHGNVAVVVPFKLNVVQV